MFQNQSNAKIIIDASHGGNDFGMVYNDKNEKDIVLDISKYMYDEFSKLGIPVYITRDSDITLSDTERNNKILNYFGNLSDVIVISNHVDSEDDNIQIIYALRNDNTLSNLINKELVNSGYNVKEPYQRRLPSDTSKDYYSLHRNTGNLESLLIQYSNMSNYQNVLNNYKKYVDLIVNAVSEYLNINNKYYIVKSGDTLYSLAKKFNTTVNNLKKLNNLTSDVLTIGQKLLLDSNNVDSNLKKYIIKSGDTLYSIAREYGVTVDDIKKANDLNSNYLSIGQIIYIPNLDSSEDIIYIVKKGDNLYSISRMFNTTVKDLMQYNKLNSNLLNIGQIIRIPNKLNESIYIVKSGDTLYSIANKYNTSVSSIVSKNNLNNNILTIGQKLII